MDDAWFIVQVFDGTQQLFEIVPWKLFVKASSCILYFYIAKQVSLFYQFEHNEKDLDGFARVFDNYLTIAVILNQLNDVWMI